MHQRKKLIVTIALISLMMGYLTSEELRLVKQGFPRRYSQFDEVVWRTCDSLESLLSQHRHVYSDSVSFTIEMRCNSLRWDRKDVVNDLLCNYKNLFVQRDTLIRHFGRGYTWLYSPLQVRNDNDFSHKYIAGVCPSGYCWLEFYYDNKGNLLRYTWYEDQ